MPDSAGTMPGSAGSIPDSAGSIPGTAGSLPDSAVPMPAGAVPIPAHAVPIPAHAVLMPAHAVPIPAHAVPIPAHAVPIPAHAVPIPAHAVPMPAHAVPMPAHAVPMPDSAGPMPDSAGSIPDSAGSIPGSAGQPIHRPRRGLPNATITGVTLRRALTILGLAAIVVMCTATHLLQLPFVDRTPIARAMAARPDRQWPQYPRFLESVRAHTKPGDSIAVFVPAMGWDDGYSYAYYRASYFLTGREVLPLVTPENGRLPQNLLAARYIAAFGVRLRLPADVVWQGQDGALVRLRLRESGVGSRGSELPSPTLTSPSFSDSRPPTPDPRKGTR
jgi:hypothetical protein